MTIYNSMTNTQTKGHISEIKSAIRRCQKMGKYAGWKPEFNNHQLAASLDNHTWCIDVERQEDQPDWFAILCWTLNMARSINAYCDTTKVADDAAAQYWLERFLWRVNSVCEMQELTDKIFEPKTA